MPSDLLDDVLIEVTRVAKEAISDLVGVLKALEDVGRDGKLRALA